MGPFTVPQKRRSPARGNEPFDVPGSCKKHAAQIFPNGGNSECGQNSYVWAQRALDGSQWGLEKTTGHSSQNENSWKVLPQ